MSPHMSNRLAAGRYELGEELDRGGMGTVFVAYDTYQNRRRVALKTILGTPESVHLELFQRELSVLGSLSHPNIVDVYDSGYLDEQGGTRKPFFVMPLLEGMTLDKRRQQMGGRGHFTVDESMNIIDQVARGLMAAHGRGIIHRDLKPSNIFVLPDLSVKIIDFGVAQLMGAISKSGQKGTLLYMAPEQIAENQSSALSDQFSLGAVFYEILVGRRAFERDNEKKVIDAILREIPPIATELDRNIPMVVSQIVHKMLAKKPDRRFASMQDVIETLKKANRREPIEYFNPENFNQSIQSARAAFQRKNFELASEILYTIEAEGYVDAEALRMRQEALAAIRGSRVERDLKYAHELVEDGNLVLAGEKIATVLGNDPDNIDALALEKEVRKKLEAQNIASLKRLARQHIGNRNFDRARESLERVLKLNETDAEALQTLNEVDRLDEEFRRLSGKQQELYQSARRAWQHGEVTSALGKIERVLSLDSDMQSPDPEQRTAYERFFQEVRARADSLRTARAEIQRSIERRDFGKARELCDAVLADDANNASFQALRVDIEDRQQRALLETVAEVDAKLNREPRLDERLKVLEAAAAQFPGEPHFERHLQAAQRKQDTVNRLIEKARLLEEQRRFDEAVSLWEIVETTYAAFPGLTFELTRVRELQQEKRREERRIELAQEVARYLDFSDFDKAEAAVHAGSAEMPGDAVLNELASQVAARRHNFEEAAQLLKDGRSAREAKDWTAAATALRRAYELQPKDREVRAEYLFTLTNLAREQVIADPAQARALIVEGLHIETGHAGLRTLAYQIDGQSRGADLQRILERARFALANGDLAGAISAADEGSAVAPGNAALEQLQQEINAEFTRRTDLETLQRIESEIGSPASAAAVETSLAVVKQINARSGARDHRIAVLSDDLSQKLSGLRRDTRVDLEPPPRSAVVDLPAFPPSFPLQPISDLDVTLQTVSTVARTTARGWLWPALAAGLAVLLGMGSVAWWLSHRKPVLTQFELAVEVAPPGAEVTIDGVAAGRAPMKKSLAAGQHRVEARQSGFKDAAKTVSVGPQSSGKVVLAMEVDGIPVHFVTDYRSLLATLNGKPFVDEEQRGSVTGMLSVNDGSYVLASASGNITARFELNAKAGRLEVKGPATVNLTKVAVLVTGPEGTSRWLFSAGTEVLVDGASISKKPDTPIAAGQHKVKLGSWEGAFESGGRAEAFVFMTSGKLSGDLAITANVPEAEIFLDNEKNHLRTPAKIPSVPVRNVRVRIQKDGYESYTAVVPIIANSTTQVNVQLKKLTQN